MVSCGVMGTTPSAVFTLHLLPLTGLLPSGQEACGLGKV